MGAQTVDGGASPAINRFIKRRVGIGGVVLEWRLQVLQKTPALMHTIGASPSHFRCTNSLPLPLFKF